MLQSGPGAVGKYGGLEYLAVDLEISRLICSVVPAASQEFLIPELLSPLPCLDP